MFQPVCPWLCLTMTVCVSFSLQFPLLLLHRELAATCRRASWLFLTGPGSYFSHPLALLPSPNPAYHSRDCSDPHLLKASLWCQVSDNLSPTTLAVSVPIALTAMLHSFTFTLNYYCSYLILSHLCGEIGAPWHKDCILHCWGGPVTPSLVSCTQTLIYLLH